MSQNTSNSSEHNSPIKAFENDKYHLIRQAFSEELLSVIQHYIFIQKQNGNKNIDPMFPNAFCLSNDPLCESLLLHTQKVVERTVGKSLIPTYSFARVYKSGDFLEKHVDREACEYSCTITLDYHSNYLWPINLKPNIRDVSVSMDRGDLLIYKGCEVEHWRERFEGEIDSYWVQLFVHYVDKNGMNKDHAYDKRVAIGMPYSTRYREYNNFKLKYNSAGSDKNYPFYKQTANNDCGTTCLKMISEYYNLVLPSLSEIEVELLTKGVSLSQLQVLAEKIGFKTMAIEIKFDDLMSKVELPCIVYSENLEHYIVLYEAFESKVVVGNPAEQDIYIYSREFFISIWQGMNKKGICLLLEVDSEK